MTAFVSQARFSWGAVLPGLYNVEGPDGRFFNDLTKPQVLALAAREGWQLQPR